MKKPGQKHAVTRVRGKAGLWLAWTIALVFHAIILLLPIGAERPVSENAQALIELQLINFKPPAPATPAPEPLPEPIHEITPEAVASLADAPPETVPEEIEPPSLTPIPLAPDKPRDLENMSESERSQLTSAVLMRQYIAEESETDRIFGRRIEDNSTEWQREFHYPVRQSMISMLDKPLPDIPFAYQKGLVYFAYDPGVKGDLQRFWDVITPEFGWRTKYGTEVKCIWVLVIAACGWK